MDGATPPADIDGLVRDFAFSPRLYVAESRVASHVPPGVVAFLAAGDREAGRLDTFLIRSLGLGSLVPAQAGALAKPPARLWLLPGEVLVRLVRHMGLALNGAVIAAVIDRGARGRLKAALGAGEYEFAVNRGLLLTKRKAARPLDPANDADPAAVIDAAGWDFLARTLAGLPEAVLRRILVKLPADGPWEGLADAAPPGPSPEADQAYTLARKICREVAPQWAALFV